jgi:hypothetical protein
MYEGSCTKTEDCRKGLECRPNPKDATKKICLGAATETCATCDPATVIDETSCKKLIDDAVSKKDCPKCEPGTATVTPESCKNLIDDAKAEATRNCPAPASAATCAAGVGFCPTCPAPASATTCAQFTTQPNSTNCSQFCNCPTDQEFNNRLFAELEKRNCRP